MVDAENAKDCSTVTTKYRLVFIPVADYVVLKAGVPSTKLSSYLALDENKIENFSIGDSLVVYVSDAHKNFLTKKASKGECI